MSLIKIQGSKMAHLDSKHDELLKALAAYIACKGANEEAVKNTPTRFVTAFEEMSAGYSLDASEILSKQFEQDDDACYDGIVLLRDIPFVSLCEHHLLPFTGTASVAYIPNPETRRVVGLSKLARLVDVYAKRMQLQERLCAEIVNALETELSPLGSACVIHAVHSCMVYRGAQKSGASMVTSSIKGVFREDGLAREELLSLIRIK
jgi:GTP cyclohydrolase I